MNQDSSFTKCIEFSTKCVVCTHCPLKVVGGSRGLSVIAPIQPMAYRYMQGNYDQIHVIYIYFKPISKCFYPTTIEV